jgi:CheY-like chemotaxis protein
VTLKGVALLVVDDNDDGREMLVTALRQYGAKVKSVATAREALDVLLESHFAADVLISDVGMPNTDGYEFIRQIRANAVTRDIPAIAVTAYANPEDRIQAVVAGYQAHLAKPVDPSVIAASVASLVGTKPTLR